jgi:hypothetical protein
MRCFVSESRSTFAILAVFLVLVLASSGAVIAPAHAAPQSQPTHTLILRSSGVITNYFVAVSGTIVSGPQETSDTVRRQQVRGYIGGATDNKDGNATDVIKYTGYITAFSAEQPQLRAILDGTVLRNASILNAHHIQMRYTSSNKAPRQPSRYTIVVSGPIVRGEDTEDRDTPTNTTTVSGWLQPGDSDGFYFRGGLNPAASSVSRPTKFRINSNQWTANPSTTTHTTSAPSPTPTPQPSSTSRSKAHTLVIKQQNGSVGYTVTVTGSVTLDTTESSDSIAGNTVRGRVGGLPWKENITDSKDVIHFTGKLLGVEYEDEAGTIHIILDGEQTDPNSLINTPQQTPMPTTSTLPPTTATTPPTRTVTSTAHPTTSTTTTPQSSTGSGFSLQLWIILGLAIVSVLIFYVLES